MECSEIAEKYYLTHELLDNINTLSSIGELSEWIRSTYYMELTKDLQWIFNYLTDNMIEYSKLELKYVEIHMNEKNFVILNNNQYILKSSYT